MNTLEASRICDDPVSFVTKIRALGDSAAVERVPRPVGPHMLEIAQRLLAAQQEIILANVEGAIAGADPEHLHRIRVAIRRLRSVLRVFRKYLPETDPIDDTLRLLGDRLGPARDLDVWVLFLHSKAVTAALEGNRRWRTFVRHHEQVRQLELATVRRELRSARFNACRRRMAKLLHTQLPVLLCAPSPVALEELAGKKFLKEVRRVRELARLRHSASPEKLHRLRAELRRARYLGEFFGPALGPDAGKLTRRLHQTEKPLAQIHDVHVGLALAQKSGPAMPRAYAGLLQARREQQWRLVEPAWRRFVALAKNESRRQK